LRGIENLRIGGAVAPFAVEKGVRAEMDDGAHLEILPFDLLRRGFYVGESLGAAPCECDQNEHDQDKHEHSEPENVLRTRSDSHAQIVTLDRFRFLRCRSRSFASAAANARKSRATKVQFHLP